MTNFLRKFIVLHTFSKWNLKFSFQIVSVHSNQFIFINLAFQLTVLKKIISNKIKQVLINMVQTLRQQANFDEVEEEAEIYHRIDTDDTRIMMENGLEA